MYDWLGDALEGPATVVTANRRLARVLHEEYSARQLRDGRSAWRSPDIHAWPDWLVRLAESSADQGALPLRLNRHQSRLLWERSLAREFEDQVPAGLVRLSQDAWQRLADWQVPIREVARAAQNDDQRRFASVAGRYLAILEHKQWVDEAGLPAVVRNAVDTGMISAPARCTFAGFDRSRPAVNALIESLAARGCEIRVAPARSAGQDRSLLAFENPEAEFRAAGAWARQLATRQHDARIAIIADSLDRDADRKTRLVREGLVPGWQYVGETAAQAVNVSFGRRVNEYPAIAIALLLLQWLVRDLGSTDVSHLLRTPLLAAGESGARNRLELRLRQLPDRKWAPAMVASALRGDGEAQAWDRLMAMLVRWRRKLHGSAAPAEWAGHIDGILEQCGWPGAGPLSSRDFQLVNRWRELLNELARLDLLTPRMSFGSALQRLEQICSDTVFQPESGAASVQLLGPLEASGAEFDAIWICGLTASAWPPHGNASPLLSRRLQRETGMPDAEPADTLAYARSTLRGLCDSANTVVGSYPLTDDDSVQDPSTLLDDLGIDAGPAVSDPGWYAGSLTGLSTATAVDDPVPGVSADEELAGGAATLQRQLVEPLSAFVTGRLAVDPIAPLATGITPSLRGNVIHDALHRLYAMVPDRAAIAAWSDAELSDMLDHTVGPAFARHERNSDPVLLELLRLERDRVTRVLRQFVIVDAGRDDFEIESVEEELEFRQGLVRLRLRADRIDRISDGSVVILDYKTGARKSFLLADGEPRDVQLVAYADAIDRPVAALALAYIDSRAVSFEGAGRGYRRSETWPDQLAAWKQRLRGACEELARGDVRINRAQAPREARFLNLLSRYTEIARDI